MGAAVHCFKRYEVINKNDYSGDYDFIMQEDRDADYVHPTILWDIDNFLETLGIEHGISNIISLFGELYLENLSKKEVQCIESNLIKPETGLGFINENKIIEKIGEYRPAGHENMTFVMDHIVKYLKEGFYIIYYN